MHIFLKVLISIHGKPQAVLDVAEALFRKLGYSSPREIIELRRNGKSIFQLAQKMGFDNLSKLDELLSKNDTRGLKEMVDKL